jgi:hypothetical protein
MDRRKFNGGPRPNSGRPKKADEIKLIEQMDGIMAPDEAWQKVAKLCQNGDIQALKLWIEYRFGKPKQSVDLTSGGDKLPSLTVEFVKPNED